MVVSICVPLKASDEAIVNFLLSVVFAPRKMSTDANRRECLRHDVRGACRLIKWIAREDRANTKSLTVASNLVYGNTIVLSHQVARLFRDALRAKGVVAFSSFEDEEEDRRRRTREQMMGFDEESKTPTKRKRKSKAGVDDSLLVAVPGTPISTALRQTITMPDVFAVSRNDDIAVCDDLITPTNEDYEMFYGMLRSEDPEMEIPDYTFIDRLSQPNHENVMNETMDFQRPSGDFIQNQMETPRKSRPRPIDDLDDLEQLEPHPGLADILLYGRLPLLETERRRTSLEDEMESARAQGHDFETPQRLEPPRLPSERMELETDLVIPRSTRRMPKTPRLTPATLTQFPPDSKHRIPLREMHRLMEDCSELHHRNTSVFLPTQRAKTPAKDLLQNVPFLFQKGCNKDLLELFQRRPTKYVAFNGVEEVEEEEEQAPRLETLEPIELSQLKFKQATLNPTPRESPVHRPEYAFDMEMVEQPRHEEPPVSSHEQIQNHGFMDDAILEEVRRDQYEEQTADRFSNRNGPRSSPPSNDKSAAEIRETMLAEMYSKSPFGIHLDSLLDLENSTAREAARTFYVALELLKERQIKVNQIDAFGPIDLWISGHDSEDLMELAESEMGDEDF